MALRILFVGGTGVISGACARAAAQAGHDVTVLTRGNNARLIPPDVRQVSVDVRDRNALIESLGGAGSFDVVADFLSYVPEDIRRVMAVLGGRMGQYIFVSSATVYQKPPRVIPVAESSPLGNPFWQYAQNKIECEILLDELRGVGTTPPITVVRPSHTYDETRIPTLGGWTDISRLRAGLPVVVHGDGTSQWTITHSSDFAVAFLGLLGQRAAFDQSFTVAGTHAPTWNQIYGWLADAAGVTDPLCVHVPSDVIAHASPEYGARLLGDRTHTGVFDTSKITALVPEFVTTVDFAEGAQRIMSHHDTHTELQRTDPHVDALFESLMSFGTPEALRY